MGTFLELLVVWPVLANSGQMIASLLMHVHNQVHPPTTFTHSQAHPHAGPSTRKPICTPAHLHASPSAHRPMGHLVCPPTTFTHSHLLIHTQAHLVHPPTTFTCSHLLIHMQTHSHASPSTHQPICMPVYLHTGPSIRSV